MSKEQQKALDRGIELFNERRFIEAHEEWERKWRLMAEGGDKTFFQGLIYAAAAMLSYTRRECSGAKELLSRSVSSLRAGLDGNSGVSIGRLIDDLTQLQGPFESCTYDLSELSLPIIRRNLVDR
jgi:predicted metal-dependent hydrolase